MSTATSRRSRTERRRTVPLPKTSPLKVRTDARLGVKRSLVVQSMESRLVDKALVEEMVQTKKMRPVKDPERVIRFIASTEKVDRMGDIVRQDWDLEHFRGNPVILWDHDQKQPIGRSVREEVIDDPEDPDFKRVGRHLVSYVEFMGKEHGELPERVFKMYRDAFLKGGSVGYVPTLIDEVIDEEQRKSLGLGPVGVVFEKNELAEFTLCTVPANQQALATEMKNLSAETLADLAALGLTVTKTPAPTAPKPNTTPTKPAGSGLKQPRPGTKGKAATKAGTPRGVTVAFDDEETEAAIDAFLQEWGVEGRWDVDSVDVTFASEEEADEFRDALVEKIPAAQTGSYEAHARVTTKGGYSTRLGSLISDLQNWDEIGAAAAELVDTAASQVEEGVEGGLVLETLKDALEAFTQAVDKEVDAISSGQRAEESESNNYDAAEHVNDVLESAEETKAKFAEAIDHLEGGGSTMDMSRGAAVRTQGAHARVVEKGADLGSIASDIEKEADAAGGQDTDEGAAILDALSELEGAFDQEDVEAAQEAAQHLRTAFEATDNSMSSILDDVDKLVEEMGGDDGMIGSSAAAVTTRSESSDQESSASSGPDSSLVPALVDELRALISSASSSADLEQVQATLADASEALEDLAEAAGCEPEEPGEQPAGQPGDASDHGRPPLEAMGARVERRSVDELWAFVADIVDAGEKVEDDEVEDPSELEGILGQLRNAESSKDLEAAIDALQDLRGMDLPPELSDLVAQANDVGVQSDSDGAEEAHAPVRRRSVTPCPVDTSAIYDPILRDLHRIERSLDSHGIGELPPEPRKRIPARSAKAKLRNTRPSAPAPDSVAAAARSQAKRLFRGEEFEGAPRSMRPTKAAAAGHRTPVRPLRRADLR